MLTTYPLIGVVLGSLCGGVVIDGLFNKTGSKYLSRCVVAAVALGAEVLEKHFTYHLRMPGDDHEGALTPEMLRNLVQGVGRIEAMLGTEEKEPVAAEAKAMAALRVKMREVGFD